MSDTGNTTVFSGFGSDVGSNDFADREFANLKKPHFSPSGRSNTERKQKDPTDHEPFLKATDYFNEDRPFFVKIGSDGALPALIKLNDQLVAAKRNSLISKKSPTDWIGREISPGHVGLINHGGLPKLLTTPGRYPGFPLRNWWARTYHGTKGISDTVIEFLGLIVVSVSQNQAAVISDPQNKIFVIKNGGFAALSLQGSYKVLAVVDQTHLPTPVKDGVTKATLGWIYEVKMKSITGMQKEQDYVVALFLNIPASNCAILQRGDDLELLPAGQHYITNPNVTLRGLFTLGENQLEMPTKDIFTRDQVPVSLTIYLKWQLTEPLKLTTHGYNTPFEALRDKTQSILTQIVAHLDYSSMVKQRSLGPDNMENGDDASSAFLDALRTRAMDEMHLAALEYGIVLKDLAVIDRQFKGEIAATMDKLTTRALQAQVEAANVDRENSNKVKQEEGALSVAKIKAQARNTQADSDAYQVVAAARAAAQSTQIAAEAQAEATRLAAHAEAEAIRIRAQADANVLDEFARDVAMRRIDVQRIGAFGNRTVFAPIGPAEQMGNALAVGFASNVGASRSKA